MAVTLTGSQTGLFTRLGRIIYVIQLVNDFLGGSSADDMPTEVEDIMQEIDGASMEIRECYEDIPSAFETYQASAESFLSTLKDAAQQLLIRMVDDDDALPSQTVSDALDRLIKQMEDNSDSVDASAPSISVSADANNTGNGKVIYATKNGKGKTLENMKPEDFIVKITNSSNTGSETGNIKGEANQASTVLSHNWPDGSGASATFTVLNPASNGFLNDGSFDSFTSDDPDQWTIAVGTASTTVLEEGTEYMSIASSSLEIAGNGSELTQLTQDVSSKSWKTRTNYPVSVWYKLSATPTTGVLQIDLYDSTGAAIIQDDEGTNNSLSIDLTTGAANWTHANTTFRLPDPLPTSIVARVHLTTALDSGKQVWVDDLMIGPAMTSTYSGGPEFVVVRGPTDFAADDQFVATVTNAFDGDFQKHFLQLFDQPTKLLPSDTGGSETVADSLIG